jgi:hypothetical protein
MTFTDDFVVSAWVKLTSYGAISVIASRSNGTSGWLLYVDASGAINLQGNNAGGSNLSKITSYQSIPLNKWVHVAAQLDMSTFTSTTTTSYVMLDGVDVPAVSFRSGTNPTALVQAGNLEIGSSNGGGTPFPGKIAQVAIYSAKVTQANIRATISQGLAGTETSLISAYSFNNAITDLNTSNANNLTANNSAGATNADSPFGGQAGGTISGTLDYGIVTAVTNTTLTVQVPEGCTVPTSGGVSAVSYSPYKAPYGMPIFKNRWCLEFCLNSGYSQANPINGTVYNPQSAQVSAPVGAWTLYGEGVMQGAGTSNITAFVGFSTATNTISELRTIRELIGAASTSFPGVPFYTTLPLNLSAQITYYLNIKTNQTSMTSITLNADGNQTTLTLENAYL